MSERDLQFKPLSEGLGFHPFSNGLPYTPSKPVTTPKRDFPGQTSSYGSGATAAGRPEFSFPKSTALPRIVLASPALASAVAPAPLAAPALVPALGWDYVGRRFFAFSIDSAFNICLGALVLTASLWPSPKVLGEVLADSDLLLLTAAFLLFFNWALIAAQEVAIGTTIGKKIFGLSLDGSALALLVRALVFIPSALLCGLGLLGCVVGPDYRGLHDWVSGIQPHEN